GYPGQVIEKGYAAFATDEGHTGMGAVDWAVKGPGQVDQDAITDFFYRADQVLSRMGKEFTTAFYAHAIGASRKISYSYFSGCSGGGRDAFVAASYFPEAFDGIVGGSAYNLMGRAHSGHAGRRMGPHDAGPRPAAIWRRFSNRLFLRGIDKTERSLSKT